MPQTYPSELSHRRSSSAPTSEHIDMPLDVDDSIVLSDLLRTGEASRLRRRGAMRIDHNHPHHATTGGHVMPGPRLSSPNIVLVERSNWDSDSDLESPSFTSYWNMDPPNRFGRRHPRSSRRFGPYSSSGINSNPQGAKEEYVYTLVCGSEAADCNSDHVEPFTPSVLPLYPPSSSSVTKRQKPTKKSTGCGTLVHLHAAPRSNFRMWTARTPASDSVILLDGCYFDEKEASRFMRNQCGCVSEGVGCAVCGNPLGTRYTPCKSASEGFSCPRLDKNPPNPASPFHNDWSSAKPLHTKPSQCIYTFFSDAVTPTPSFSFPPPPVRPARSRSLEGRPASPPTAPPFLTPERYMYPPYDEEDSDSENYPPHIADTSAGWGWRSMTSPIFPSVVDTNVSTVLPNPPVVLPPPSLDPASLVPRDGVLTDRFVDMAPAPMLENQATSPQPWGVNPPSPTAFHWTRTGRLARWSSIGRSFPSLSSGLGGSPHDNRPVSPLSFYDRQLMAASEREVRHGRHGDVAVADAAHDRPASTQEGFATLDPDGGLVSETAADVSDGENKPTESFDR